jgi:GTP-binding protein
MPMDQTDPIANYRTIRHELEQYSADLAKRPEIIVVTKSELPGSEDVHKRLCEEARREDVHLVSAVTGSGLNRLVRNIADLLVEQATVTK